MKSTGLPPGRTFRRLNVTLLSAYNSVTDYDMGMEKPALTVPWNLIHGLCCFREAKGLSSFIMPFFSVTIMSIPPVTVMSIPPFISAIPVTVRISPIASAKRCKHCRYYDSRNNDSLHVILLFRIKKEKPAGPFSAGC